MLGHVHQDIAFPAHFSMSGEELEIASSEMSGMQRVRLQYCAHGLDAGQISSFNSGTLSCVGLCGGIGVVPGEVVELSLGEVVLGIVFSVAGSDNNTNASGEACIGASGDSGSASVVSAMN